MCTCLSLSTSAKLVIQRDHLITLQRQTVVEEISCFHPFNWKKLTSGADPAFWKGGVKCLKKGWAPSELVSKAGGAGEAELPEENVERLALKMSVLKSWNNRNARILCSFICFQKKNPNKHINNNLVICFILISINHFLQKFRKKI